MKLFEDNGKTHNKTRDKIVLIVLGIILAYCAFSFVSSTLGLTEYTPIITSQVPTPSMFPTIDQRDVIFVGTYVGFDDVTVGDIIVFDVSGVMVVHRVIDFKDRNLLTKGDYNPEPDTIQITEQMYVGSVIFVLKYGFVLAVLIMGCCLGFYTGYALQKKKHKQKT